MFTNNENEVVLKEKYGSSSQERLYVLPTDQRHIVILDNERISDLVGWFTRIFLPQGYPDSVSKDYVMYQIWDTAQAFCSTVTGILATQEVLRGVGVGDTSATPWAATVTWVIKDGCGHIGKIVFAYSHGTYLDAYSKKWRLYADILNDAAMCIEIALPLFKNYTTFALCASTVMKAIVGVTGGATRAAMTQHHALRGNLADVSAKDSAQETAVNLIASFAAVLIISLVGNSLLIFGIMVVLHIVFNYLAVRAVCLRTLNEPRFLQLIDMYLKYEIISTPCEINCNEPIIFYQLGKNLLDLKLSGFQIKMGNSVKSNIRACPGAQNLRSIKEIYNNRQYIIIPNVNFRIMYILIKEGASTDDVLCSYFHAVLLSIITCAINDAQLAIYSNKTDPRPFAQVCHTLQSTEWSRIPISQDRESYSGFIYKPSYDLMKYVDKIAQTEWHRIRAGLQHTGWDLSKHLLMVDEWRIINDQTIIREPVSMDENTSIDLLHPSSKLTSHIYLDRSESKENNFTIEPDIHPSVSTLALLDPQRNVESNKQPFSSKLSIEQQKNNEIFPKSDTLLEHAKNKQD